MIVEYPVAPRWPWPADVDYLEATARQYDEDQTEANRNAFLWEFLLEDMDAGEATHDVNDEMLAEEFRRLGLRVLSGHHFRCNSLDFMFGE